MWPEEDLSRVYEHLHNHIFTHIYPHVFHPNGESDKQRDQYVSSIIEASHIVCINFRVFSDHLEALSQRISPSHRLLRIAPVSELSCACVN